MDDENNNQEFKSMSPTTTEANYKAFNEPKKKKSNGAGFGKVVILPFVCGVLGAALTVGLCVNVPSIKQAFLEKLVVTDSSNKDNNSSENSSTNLNTQLISLQGYSDTAVGVAKKVQPSIVAISVEYSVNSIFNRSSTTATAKGSGIIISEDGYILTNNHVVNSTSSSSSSFYEIEKANKVTVKLYNDDKEYEGKIVGTDSQTDLAVIKIEKNGLKAAELGDSDAVQVGEFAMAIGNPLGLTDSVTAGIISAVNREVTDSDGKTYKLIQTDAAINSGNSGGALLSANGEVIGINSVKYSDTSVEGIGYAIPINTAAPIINDLITKEKVDESDSAYLGITGVDVTDDVAKTYNMPSGVYVAQVTGGSAAEQAGIQKGDIITEFDGKQIGSMEELSSTMEYYKAGTTVDVKIERSTNGEYQEQTISVTLGKKN